MLNVLYLKRFSINETHQILRFGSLSRIVHRSEIDSKLLEILWNRDKLYYFLFWCGIYDEVNRKFILQRMLEVFILSF